MAPNLPPRAVRLDMLSQYQQLLSFSPPLPKALSRVRSASLSSCGATVEELSIDVYADVRSASRGNFIEALEQPVSNLAADALNLRQLGRSTAESCGEIAASVAGARDDSSNRSPSQAPS
jgi:hypothetical protein